jgi:hypothetical protein
MLEQSVSHRGAHRLYRKGIHLLPLRPAARLQGAGCDGKSAAALRRRVVEPTVGLSTKPIEAASVLTQKKNKFALILFLMSVD